MYFSRFSSFFQCNFQKSRIFLIFPDFSMKLWIAVVSFKAQILKYYAKSQKIWKNIQKGQKM